MCVFSMYGNSQQRRGWALRLMKMFWERKPKINMCSVCGENEEKMILFLTNSNQVENVVKVSQAALGKVFFWGGFFFYFIQKQRLLQVNEILRFCDWYIWYASAAVAIPTVPWFENRASSTVWCLSNSRRDVLLRRPRARPKIFNLKFSHY